MTHQNVKNKQQTLKSSPVKCTLLLQVGFLPLVNIETAVIRTSNGKHLKELLHLSPQHTLRHTQKYECVWWPGATLNKCHSLKKVLELLV